MRGLRIISAGELRANVCFEDLIEPVSTAFQQSSAGLAENGLIVMFPAARPDLGDVYVKAGALRGHAVFVVKVSPWFAANRDRGDGQGGFVAVFDTNTGRTLAILVDEHYLSDIRTAAAGALAARAFAPDHVRTAAVLGSGTQAYWQPQALYRERPFHTLVVWGRDSQKAEALTARLQPELPNVEMRVSTDLEATVRGADVLITATSSVHPLIRGEWLRKGQLITAIGADDPTKCELDVATLARARVFVDSLDATAANGDIHRAIQRGAYSLSQVAGEIGEVLAGRLPPRNSRDDITIAKFVGLGVQDLVAAETALEALKAPRTRPGTGRARS
jgi:ornithine cyclodeaminase/alanine dehydrogenase-like protein (mu-crystallin family)